MPSSSASPDHWHALHSIDAALSGKDVYVEKCHDADRRRGAGDGQSHPRKQPRAAGGQPAAFSIQLPPRMHADPQRLHRQGDQGDRRQLCRRLGVQPACPARSARPWIGTSGWGRWSPSRSTRTSTISRSRPGWLSIKDFCGGEICGWGAHDLDQVQWALGMDESGPTEVWVEGQPYKPWVAEDESRVGRFFGAKETIIHMMYPGGIHLELSEDANPNGGALFIGEKGQIRIDRGRFEVSEPEWKTIPLESMPVQLYTARNHYRNFVDGIKERKKCVCDVETGHRSATVCHLGNIARWVSQQTQTVGTKLNWDPVKEEFKNNALANSMLDRPRRKGYELPKV